MGSSDHKFMRPRSRPFGVRTRSNIRFSSPYCRQRSRSMSRNSDEHRMGLRKSKSGAYAKIDTLPTGGLATAARTAGGERPDHLKRDPMQSSQSAQKPRLSRHEIFMEGQLREFMKPEVQAQIYDMLGLKEGFKSDCKGNEATCQCELELGLMASERTTSLSRLLSV